MARRSQPTPKKKREFCAELAENGNVSLACEALNLERRRIYEERATDPGFAATWDAALEVATERLEAEARRRAYAGVDEPVFHKGEQCGVVRKYSDTLLIFLLKGQKPATYRDNVRHEHDVGPSLAALLAKAEEPQE